MSVLLLESFETTGIASVLLLPTVEHLVVAIEGKSMLEVGELEEVWVSVV